MFSYHDATVAANNCVYRMFNVPFRVNLVCDRVNGWSLLANESADYPAETIATEYSDYPFAIYAVEKKDGKFLFDEKVCFCESRFILDAILTDAQLDKITKLGVKGKLRVGRHDVEFEQINSRKCPTMIVTDGGNPTLLDDLEDYINLTGTVFYSGYSWQAIVSRCTEGLRIFFDTPKTDCASPLDFEEYLAKLEEDEKSDS